MRVFKTKPFHRWAKKQKLTDAVLLNAVEQMEQGLIDADLGGHVYKKRVAIAGRGKSGGLRTLIAYRYEDRAFFMYGFAKNQKANISHTELHALQVVADNLLGHRDDILAQLVRAEELVEVIDDE